MNILKVVGTYWTGDETPEPTIADMLRYDDGEMISYTTSDISGLRANRRFEAEVHSNDFTPDRWKSFGLKATLVRKEKGKASCSYPDMESVSRAIHEHK